VVQRRDAVFIGRPAKWVNQCSDALALCGEKHRALDSSDPSWLCVVQIPNARARGFGRREPERWPRLGGRT